MLHSVQFFVLRLLPFIGVMIVSVNAYSREIENRKDQRATPYVYLKGAGGAVVVMIRPGMPKTRITEIHMKSIVALNPFKISFDYVVIDRAAKKYFKKLTELEELVMQRTNFDDNDLKALRKCKSIRFMNLIDSDVTDDIVDVVVKRKRLKMVFIWRTAVSLRGYQRIKAARKDMYIQFFAPNVPRFREKILPKRDRKSVRRNKSNR